MSNNRQRNKMIKFNTKMSARQVICPNCGSSDPVKECGGANILDLLVGRLISERCIIQQVVSKFSRFEWYRDNVPNTSHIVILARYALKCRGVTGVGINKLATKIAAIVRRKAIWRLPPEED